MQPKRPEPDIASIRATLCLLFPEDVARRLAALAARDRPDVRLAHLVARTSLRLRVDRWRQLVARRELGRADAPLGPSSDLRPRQSMALALHLGLQLPATELAELFERTADEIGEELYLARAALSPQPLGACPEFIPALGRYQDQSLELNQRVTLMRHISGCQECRETLETFQEIDEGLRRRLEEARLSVSAVPFRPRLHDRFLNSPRLWVGAAMLLILAVVVLGGIGISRLFGNQQPVPLLPSPTSAPAPAGGWLLTADPNQGSLQAIDLASGSTRDISAAYGSPGSSFALTYLSPNQKLIASWGPMYSATGPASQVPLVVRQLDGTSVFQHVWALPNAPTLAGWLDSTHVLMQSFEQLGGPNSDDYSSSVISVDITNGETRSLLTITGGTSVEEVAASPDGTMVAVSYGDPKSQSDVVELCAIQGNRLGPPVATISHVVSGNSQSAPVWSPDSQHLYLSRVDDISAPVISGTSAYIHWSHRSIIAVDRSGRVTTAVSPPGKLSAAIPIAVFPGNRQLVYEVEDLTRLRSDIITSSIWESSLIPEQGSSRQLLKEVQPTSSTAIVSPNTSQQMLLEVIEPSYLASPTENASANGNVDWPVIYVADAGGGATPVESSPSLTNATMVGWVPEAGLPDLPSTDSVAPIKLKRATTVSNPDFDGAIDSSSIVSPDDTTIVTSNPKVGSGSLLSLDRVTGDTNSWSEDLRDPAWFGQSGEVLIAATLPDKYLPSRLEWLATTNSQAGQGFDGIAADPASIANSRSLAYAHPVVSANGLATAFFVIDSQTRQAQLWVATLHHQPRQVDQWTYGSQPAGDLPLPATWVNDTTLLYASPGSWNDGLPRDPTLIRLTLEPDGTTQQQALITFHRTGFDRGLAVAGMTLNPNGSTLAVRLRHYSQNNARSGVRDAILLLPARNLRQQLEVDRAAYGSGLSWSPDGRWLAFDLKGDIGVVNPAGTSMRYVTSAGEAGAPLWISSDEIWFTTTHDGKTTNQRTIFPLPG